MGVLLSSLGALGRPSASLSSAPGGGLRQGLRQMRGPAIIWSKSENFLLPNGLVDLLGLELLEL